MYLSRLFMAEQPGYKKNNKTMEVYVAPQAGYTIYTYIYLHCIKSGVQFVK